MSSFVSVSSSGDDETCFLEGDDSTVELYAADLPQSFADRLVTFVSKAKSDSTMSPIGIMAEEDPDAIPTNVEGCSSPEPPYMYVLSLFPSDSRRDSWNAIDAATAERSANMQEDIAAHEVRALKRCHELRQRIYRKATKSLRAPEPLIIPEPWVILEALIQRLAEHPFLLEEYLELEQATLNLIEVRKGFLQFQIRNSPQFLILPNFRQEMENLDLLEKRRKETLASRLLVNLLLEVFRHVTAKLLIDMTEKDGTKKTAISEVCYRLSAYSTHPDDDGELIIAVQNIEDMEREHLPWRYTAIDCSSATSPTSSIWKSSLAPAPSSPPAVEVRLSPEPVSSPPPTKDTALKDPSRLRVRFEECLPTRAPAAWRKLRRSLPSISSSPRNPSSSPLSQYKLQQAVRTEGREHGRNTEMSHLTHPIVMMGMYPAEYEYPVSYSLPPQPVPTEQEQTAHSRSPIEFGQMPTPKSPEPIGFGSGPYPFTHPFAQKPMLDRSEAAHPQDAWLVATGTKRRASEELRSAYYDDSKKARTSGTCQNEKNTRDTAVEDADTKMGHNTTPSRGRPTPKMAAAIARAHAKREERQKKEQGHTFTSPSEAL